MLYPTKLSFFKNKTKEGEEERRRIALDNCIMFFVETTTDPTCATLNFVNTECQTCADDLVGIGGGIITNINEDGVCDTSGTCNSDGTCVRGK